MLPPIVCLCGKAATEKVPPELLSYGSLVVFVEFACPECLEAARADRWAKVQKAECVWCRELGERSKMRRHDRRHKWLYHPDCLSERRRYPKEVKRVTYENHRAKVAGLVHDLTCHQWVEILESWGGKCAYCGEGYQEIEHKISIEGGGGTTKENIVPACRSCNRKKKHQDLPLI